MDLHALADFNLVAVHGGFGKASRLTGRPKATLSRKISELEQSLGVRLIERGARMLRLTEEGTKLHERTHGLLAAIAEAGEAAATGIGIPRGRLRVSAPVVLAHVMLSAIGARFAADHPLVQLEIVAEDRKVDPVEDGYDLVIRINPSPDDRLIGRLILEDERLLVALPTMPFPDDIGDPEGEMPIPAAMLTTDRPGVIWPIRRGTSGLARLRPEATLRYSSLLMVRSAVLAGAGAGLLPKLLVAEDLDAGRLVCWGVADEAPVAIWALQNSRHLVGAKVRAFLQALDAALGKNAPT